MKNYNENLLKDMLDYIKTYQVKEGKSPSYRNIKERFKLSSLSIVNRYVHLLTSMGKLKKNIDGVINISNNLNAGSTITAPIVGTVTCGAPIFAQENIEGNFQLPTAIFGHGEHFLLHAQGDSMIDAGIRDGDLLVIRKTESAENGQIVVALLGDEATVKTFYRKTNHIVLHPENEKYDDIISTDVKILGIVEHYIHKF